MCVLEVGVEEDLLVSAEDSQSTFGMLVKYLREPPPSDTGNRVWFQMEPPVSECDQSLSPASDVLLLFSMFCFSNKSFHCVLVSMAPAFLVALPGLSLTTGEQRSRLLRTAADTKSVRGADNKVPTRPSGSS